MLAGEMDEGPLPLDELAEWRAVTYRLASRALMHPEHSGREQLAQAATDLIDTSDELALLASFGDWRRLMEAVHVVASTASDEVAHVYTRLFMAQRAEAPCPLVESAYLDDDPAAVGWLLGDIESVYTRAGLECAIAPEPSDHVATELEFLAILCEREAEAWERHVPRAAAMLRRQQQSFLIRHLRGWLPALLAGLTAEAPGSMYQQLVEGLVSFVTYDHDLLLALLSADGLRSEVEA